MSPIYVFTFSEDWEPEHHAYITLTQAVRFLRSLNAHQHVEIQIANSYDIIAGSVQDVLERITEVHIME